MIRNSFKYIFSLAIASVFFWFAFKNFTLSDFEKLKETLVSIDYRWIVLTVVILFFSHVLRAWRWGILLSPTKQNMKLSNLFNSTMIGYAVNMALPRVGEITKTFNLAKQEKVDPKKVITSVVIERILDMLVFALLLAWAVFIFRTKMYEIFGEVKFFGLNLPLEGVAYFMVIISSATLITFAIISLYPEKISLLFERVMRRLSVSESVTNRLSNWIVSFIEGGAALKDRTKYVEIFISSIGIWGLYWVCAWLPIFAISMDTKYGLGFWEALTIVSVSAVGQLVTPAGTGAISTSAILLEKIFNVSLGDAAGYAVLAFAINFLTSVLGGAVCFLWQQRSGSVKSNDVIHIDTAKTLP